MSAITTKSLTGRIVSTFHLVGVINHDSRLLGSVKIPLTASNNIIKLQRYEYDALEEKIPNVYYFILG